MKSKATVTLGCLHVRIVGSSALDRASVRKCTAARGGTIVLLSGSGGTSASDSVGLENDFASAYLTDHYQVVELKWNTAWENTGVTTRNIQTAACRPATFLWWAYNNIYTNPSGGTRGFCAQGTSGGSGAVGYAMAWYGGGGTAFPLDKVELLSGPIFSDVKQGCIEPAASSITVCPSGQFGCVLGTQQPWSVPPAYVYGSEVGVRTWSGDDTCAWVPGGTTSADSNADWKEMSIVDGTTNPTFTYPKTAMSGWLCASVYNQSNCNGGQNPSDCMNNSSPEGQLFYQEVAKSSPANFSVYAVQTCDTGEGVSGTDATVPGITGTPNGFTAISNDMAWSAITNPNGCVKNPNR